MIAQYVQLGRRGWNILFYFNVRPEDWFEVEDSLIQLDCSDDDIKAAFKTLEHRNTGFTYTNTEYRMSVVCVGWATSAAQFASTVVHEIKHVQSHICQYYGISESGETAAYLIGYIAKRIHKMLMKYK